MKCANCGNDISKVLISIFLYDGSDRDVEVDLTVSSYEDELVATFITDRDWTGYGLDEEEQAERILCPCCKKFPFTNNSIYMEEQVVVTCSTKIN